jgi:hypothetical protein
MRLSCFQKTLQSVARRTCRQEQVGECVITERATWARVVFVGHASNCFWANAW